jgi:membrane fusion protein, heavy metal efflux system
VRSDATILIVDDDDTLSQVLGRVLTQQGYRVLRASDAGQALQLVQQQTPQLALVDLCLPDQNGLELAQHLQAQASGLPMILITAYPPRLSGQPAPPPGFRQVLTKPLDLQQLRHSIEAALGGDPAVFSVAADSSPACPTPTNGHPAPTTPTPPEKPAAKSAERGAVAGTVPATQPALFRWLKALAGFFVLAVVVGGGLFLASRFLSERSKAEAVQRSEQPSGVEPVPGNPAALRLPPDVAKKLGIQTQAAQPATQPRRLQFAGSLALDSNHLACIHSRAAGDVVELPPQGGGLTLVSPLAGVEAGEYLPVSFGDHVRENQLLAVVWSKDIGSAKSDLVDALSQLRLDQETLTKLEELLRSGSTSEAVVRQARRNVESDLIAVSRAERTLRFGWRVPEEEIQAVRDEAERIRERKGKRDPEKEKDWARVEVRAALPGIAVEKNVTVGKIVDTSADLYKIARVEQLAVWAHAYEEDLPALQALRPEQRRWTVRINADPAAQLREGKIDQIGWIIDPNQHTALVMGQVDNPEGRLRAGQFITATVELPPPENQVTAPISALIEDGRDSFVFVQSSVGESLYTLQRVAVARRAKDTVYVHARGEDLTQAQKDRGVKPLLPGTVVVTSGAIELKAALEDLQSATKSDK